jgi:hypothetical protein
VKSPESLEVASVSEFMCVLLLLDYHKIASVQKKEDWRWAIRCSLSTSQHPRRKACSAKAGKEKEGKTHTCEHLTGTSLRRGNGNEEGALLAESCRRASSREASRRLA